MSQSVKFDIKKLPKRKQTGYKQYIAVVLLIARRKWKLPLQLAVGLIQK
jgi:hypothetical protein